MLGFKCRLRKEKLGCKDKSKKMEVDKRENEYVNWEIVLGVGRRKNWSFFCDE